MTKKISDMALLKKLMVDKEYSLYFVFFVGKLHFVPEIVGKKNRKILGFKPYSVAYDNGSVSSWTTFDTRYERDMSVVSLCYDNDRQIYILV